jgi:hypothetical protein
LPQPFVPLVVEDDDYFILVPTRNSTRSIISDGFCVVSYMGHPIQGRLRLQIGRRGKANPMADGRTGDSSSTDQHQCLYRPRVDFFRWLDLGDCVLSVAKLRVSLDGPTKKDSIVTEIRRRNSSGALMLLRSHPKAARIIRYGLFVRNPQFEQHRAETRWRLSHPRRREECRTRRRKENEKHASAG